MPDAHEFTPSQRDAWRAQMAVLFLKEGNCSKLAKMGGFGERNEKTTAGYIGEFRDGKPRALRYFLGEPPRLEQLAAALDTDADRIKSIWRDVHALDGASPDRLLLPGFEDWGAADFHDGFVLPPLGRSGLAVEPASVQQTFLKDIEHHVQIVGAPGSGTSTLLRQVALWAVEDGWRISWGTDGALPRGRAELLILDGTTHRHARDLADWAKAPGHAVLQGSYGARTGIARRHWTLLPADEAWTLQLLRVVQRLAPRADSVRLQAIRPVQVRALVQSLPHPTPELVGVLLRAVVDGRGIGAAEHGLALVAATARRRLHGTQRRDQESLLRGAESWLGEAYLRQLEDPSGRLQRSAETAMIARAHAVVEEVHATAEQREVLRAVLPYADAGAAVEALRAADVVRCTDDGSDEFRFEPLLAAAMAARAIESAPIIQGALVRRRSALLSALVRSPGGPRAIAGVLARLGGPALATALADPRRDADWLGSVRWEPALVARVVAMLIATNQLDGALRPRRKRAASGSEEVNLWSALGRASELPSIADIRVSLGVIADELAVAQPEVSDAQLAMLAAMLSPKTANLTNPAIWAALPDDMFPHAPWVEHLSLGAQGLLFLADATRSAVAHRLLHTKVEEPGDMRLKEEPPPHRAWTPQVEALARTDGAALAAVLARMFEAAVSETVAHRGEPMDRRETPTTHRVGGSDWHDEVAELLSGIATALQIPSVRRREREVHAALRAQLPGLHLLADSHDVSVEAWVSQAFFALARVPSALACILAFTMNEPERVAALRRPEGILNPFWRSLLLAGVPIRDAVELLSDVTDQRLVAIPGRGAPSTWQLANDEQHLHLREWPKPTTEGWIRDVLIQTASPDELPSVPGFPNPDAGDVPDVALVDGYWKPRNGLKNVRKYLWRFVRDLGEDSLLWKLLSAGEAYSTRFELLHEYRLGRDPKRAEVDGAGLTHAVSLVPQSRLTAPQWDLLANAGLTACLDGASLWPLLASPAAEGGRPTLLAEVVKAVLTADRGLGERWLADKLREGPAAVDCEAFVEVWLDSGTSNDVLLEYLLTGAPGQPRGGGVLLALVRRDVERFTAWLRDDDTRDAALSALALLPDWQRRLGEALGDDDRLPAPGVLAHLLRGDAVAGLDVLDAAAATWPKERQCELWRSALAMGPAGRNRSELWRRLAVLSD